MHEVCWKTAVSATHGLTRAFDPCAGPPAQPLLVRKAAAYVTRILSVFGISQAAADQVGFGGEAAGSAAAGQDTAQYLDAFAAFRDGVRGLAKAKAEPAQILAACDR